MKCKTISVSLIGLFFVTSCVSHASTGRTAAQFLSLEKDARAGAMGDAFVTMSGDVGCIFYNPGGLGSMEEVQIAAAYTTYITLSNEDMKYLSIASGAPIGLGLLNRSLGVIAAGLVVQDPGDILTTKDSPEAVGVAGKNWAATLSYANQLSRLAAGLSLKLIHQQSWLESDMAYAVDLGFQYDILKFFFNRDLTQANDPSFGLKVGAAVQNWGTKIQMIDEGIPLPRELSFGISINACLRLRDISPRSNAPVGLAIFRFRLSGELTAFIDKLKESEEDLRNPYFDKKKEGVGIYAFSSSNMEKNIGAEIWLLDILAFRLGYGKIPDMPEDADRLAFGLGLRLPISHLIALLTSKSSGPGLFDRLYRETDRQLFMEAQWLGTTEEKGSITLGLKVGI